MTLKGLYVAIITPFAKGQIDETGLRKNIDFLISNGTAGIVPCGTTGESATLSWEEHRRVIDIAVNHAKGKCQVIAGVGSNNTKEAIAAAKHACEAGADAVLAITPYYNKPTQDGLVEHYTSIAGEISIPIVIYNVPSRTGTNILPSTLERLCKIRNIAAVKEASGNITQISEIKRRCGEDLTILSGDDAMTLPILSIGGTGTISVVGNIAPKAMSEMIGLWFDGNIGAAQEMHHKLLDLCNAMFIETNPIPVKAAVGLMGLASGDLRLPMTRLKEENKAKLIAVMKEFGIEV